MKKLNFKWLVVLCMAIGIVNVAKAQAYSSEVKFFLSSNGMSVGIWKFEGTTAKCYGYGIPASSVDNVRKDLSKDPNIYNNTYYENGHEYCNHSGVTKFAYCSDLSNSEKDVYRYYNSDYYGVNPSEYVYLAVSKDLKTIITWWQYVNGGEPRSVVHYISVSKEDLLPKNVVPDFIYE